MISIIPFSEILRCSPGYSAELFHKLCIFTNWDLKQKRGLETARFRPTIVPLAPDSSYLTAQNRLGYSALRRSMAPNIGKVGCINGNIRYFYPEFATSNLGMQKPSRLVQNAKESDFPNEDLVTMFRVPVQWVDSGSPSI